MKFTNLDLALALATRAMGTNEQTPILQLADYLATNPTSKIFYERALLTLGIDPNEIPSESWGTPTPTEERASEELKKAIKLLNEYWSGTDVHRRVAVRNLAWQATLLARRLDADAEAKTKYVVKRNGGHTAGLFSAHIVPATRSELQKEPAINQVENT